MSEASSKCPELSHHHLFLRSQRVSVCTKQTMSCGKLNNIAFILVNEVGLRNRMRFDVKTEASRQSSQSYLFKSVRVVV